ncbi:MAG: cytochrome c biogenesis protein CcsA, partial [Chitinophagaceae bacterium]
CFWSDQDGSFLLWMSWQSILGCILIYTAKKWEGPVLMVISFAQVCLTTMLMGIFIFHQRIGINPFALLRNEMAGAPIFSDPHYLQKYIQDGNGLNPLLQNYWMVIHPPILFLGFTSTIIPFSYAIAGLWTKNYKDWIKPALPWALFSGMVLGTGVMMGAAWAYESLTFGGYWAWDPVENASMVPWLCMIAGIHTLLAFKHTGHSLKSTFFFLITSFVLILYATFLTRSGILQNTSVHAFTAEGMMGQLLFFLFIFMIPAYFLFFLRSKEIPSMKVEEKVYSREFWMFIGSLVLFISSVFITVTTSIPVWNRIFHAHFAEPVDREFSYNKIEVFIAVLLGLGTATIQFLKYKDTPMAAFRRKIVIPTVVALFFGILIAIYGEIHYLVYGIGFLIALYLMMFTSVYSIVANFSYILLVLKGKLKSAGASVAHLGFGMML